MPPFSEDADTIPAATMQFDAVYNAIATAPQLLSSVLAGHIPRDATGLLLIATILGTHASALKTLKKQLLTTFNSRGQAAFALRWRIR